MRKFLLASLVAVLAASFLFSCQKAEEKIEIALITDVGTIDDKSFNQGAWEGVRDYAENNNKTYKYYQPAEPSNDAYSASIDLAVTAGARIVVCPGFLFKEVIEVSQKTYPDVTFIQLDAAPDSIEQNTLGIYYKEEQAGFLAGYAAVKGGYTKLGFMGGNPVPSVIRYGYGFVQGAEYAALELDVKVDIRYFYTNTFNSSPEVATRANAWYASGTQIIFACGGQMGSSVMSAAESSKAAVIGVDVDQYAASSSVVISAMKELSFSVTSTLSQCYDGTFEGGRSISLGADTNMVGLSMAHNKIDKFKQEDYDAIFAKIKGNVDNITTSIVLDVDKNGKDVKLTDLKLKQVTVKNENE